MELLAVLVPSTEIMSGVRRDERLYNLRALRRKTSMMSFTSLTAAEKLPRKIWLPPNTIVASSAANFEKKRRLSHASSHQ